VAAKALLLDEFGDPIVQIYPVGMILSMGIFTYQSTSSQKKTFKQKHISNIALGSIGDS
jgi:hypothetical protein